MKISAKNTLKGALLATAVGGMVIAGTGIASAAGSFGTGAAVTATAPLAYQMCGNFYAGADNHVGGVPTGAKPVVGATVTGQLFSSPASSTVLATFTTTTDSAGRFCLNGDSGMKSTVVGGGEVRMSTDTPTATDVSGTYTGAWSGGTDAIIDAGDFLAHGNFGLLSDRATMFNFVYRII